jgi:hypothetical protein
MIHEHRRWAAGVNPYSYAVPRPGRFRLSNPRNINRLTTLFVEDFKNRRCPDALARRPAMSLIPPNWNCRRDSCSRDHGHGYGNRQGRRHAHIESAIGADEAITCLASIANQDASFNNSASTSGTVARTGTSGTLILVISYDWTMAAAGETATVSPRCTEDPTYGSPGRRIPFGLPLR